MILMRQVDFLHRIAVITLLAATPVMAADKITLSLDWFINPRDSCLGRFARSKKCSG